MFETVFHGVPIITIPVFCDHDANAAKAEADGYARKLDLHHLTSDKLHQAIHEVIVEPKYKTQVKYRQALLRNQKESPLERGIYWTEYVIQHKGAYHLQSPAKDLNFIEYYMLDIAFTFFTLLIITIVLIIYILRFSFNWLINVQSKKIVKFIDIPFKTSIIDAKSIKKNL